MYKRVIKIDDAVRSDHYYLEASDRCFFMGEYTARGGFKLSGTNQLIANFKKDVDKKLKPEWKYKQQAIKVIGQALHQCIGCNADVFTVVPAPSSKCKTDPAYDSRMADTLAVYKQLNPKVDYRELIVRDTTTPAMHGTDKKRPPPDELVKQLRIDTSLLGDVRPSFILFDDVITTGTTFKACQMLITKHFPQSPVIGVFVSRRVEPNPFMDSHISS